MHCKNASYSVIATKKTDSVVFLQEILLQENNYYQFKTGMKIIGITVCPVIARKYFPRMSDVDDWQHGVGYKYVEF